MQLGNSRETYFICWQRLILDFLDSLGEGLALQQAHAHEETNAGEWSVGDLLGEGLKGKGRRMEGVYQTDLRESAWLPTHLDNPHAQTGLWPHGAGEAHPAVERGCHIESSKEAKAQRACPVVCLCEGKGRGGWDSLNQKKIDRVTYSHHVPPGSAG